jgi:hypothetical protein
MWLLLRDASVCACRFFRDRSFSRSGQHRCFRANQLQYVLLSASQSAPSCCCILQFRLLLLLPLEQKALLLASCVFQCRHRQKQLEIGMTKTGDAIEPCFVRNGNSVTISGSECNLIWDGGYFCQVFLRFEREMILNLAKRRPPETYRRDCHRPCCWTTLPE